jgi:oligopeptide/dipeptide ABC transporter ATP-binding protein
MTTTTPIVSCRSLEKVYTGLGGSGRGRRAVVPAVDGVDLDIAPGETVGLIGESGSGKSTLGRTLLRLDEPTGGSVTFEGQDITRLRGRGLRQVRRHMAVVFQNPYSSVNRRWRIEDVVAEPLVAYGLGSRTERRARVSELLGRVGLPTSMLERFPHELSGGQLQRVVIARALAASPRFVLADEPTASLDVSVRAQIANLLRDLQDESPMAMLVVSHDLRTVGYLADRLIVMFKGRIVEMAPSGSLQREALHPYSVELIRALPEFEAAARPAAASVDGSTDIAHSADAGCRYRSRCPLATARCATETPLLEEKRPGRWVACHVVEPAGVDPRAHHVATLEGTASSC